MRIATAVINPHEEKLGIVDLVEQVDSFLYTYVEFSGDAVGRVDVGSPDGRTQPVLDVVRSLHYLTVQKHIERGDEFH